MGNPTVRYFYPLPESKSYLRAYPLLMCMRTTRGASAASAPARIHPTGRRIAGPQTRREHGDLLVQTDRTAMRTGRPFPIGGSHQHFTVLPACGTMELVNRHAPTLDIAGREFKLFPAGF